MRASDAFVLDSLNLKEDEVSDLRDRLNAIGVAAIQALGLVFGAVDVLYSKSRNEFVVCEVNSAPGIEEDKAVKYADAIKATYGG